MEVERNIGVPGCVRQEELGKGRAETSEAKMQRSRLITGVTLMQGLLGLLCVGTSIFLLFLIHSPEIGQAHDTTVAVWGLKVGAGVIGLPGLLGLVGAYGMQKNRPWGWWVGFLIDLAVALALAYSVIDDGLDNLDPELIIVNLVFVMPVVLLLLPGVRRFYRESSGPRLRPSVNEPPVA